MSACPLISSDDSGSRKPTSGRSPLEIRGLTFGYASPDAVLHGLSATLEAGKVTALIGPNAVGKSTLLRLLLGQDSPWAGSVLLDAKPVQDWSWSQRAARMSFVPQRSTVNFAFTVEQVVQMGRYALTADPQGIGRALADTDLRSLKDQLFHSLSIGQQQGVLLARALAQCGDQGRVMLLDEPVSAMDLWHIHHTMRLLTQLAHDRGVAVLVVLHDLNLAARYADGIWLMHQGRLVASGPREQVLRASILEPVYRMRLHRLSLPAEPGAQAPAEDRGWFYAGAFIDQAR